MQPLCHRRPSLVVFYYKVPLKLLYLSIYLCAGWVSNGQLGFTSGSICLVEVDMEKSLPAPELMICSWFSHMTAGVARHPFHTHWKSTWSILPPELRWYRSVSVSVAIWKPQTLRAVEGFLYKCHIMHLAWSFRKKYRNFRGTDHFRSGKTEMG